MFRDLIPRTVVALSIATAIVALSIAFELPQRGSGETPHAAAGPHATPAAATAVTSEAAFVAAMVAHHQEAVDVAIEAAERGEREEVRALATAIVVTQAAEIDRLRAWWTAWHPDEPPPSHAPMMRRLEGLTPAQVDLVFVTDMILHHETAVAMAEDLLARVEDARPEVEALARDVIRAQGDEIVVLRGWLAAWGAPLPPHDPGR